MDSLTDKEFHKLFDRVSEKINLKGCASPKEVDDRIKSRKSKQIKRKLELKERGYASKALDNSIRQLRKLWNHEFGTRTIDEAIARPSGKIALTLTYGKAKAKDILLRRSRSRQRRGRLSFRDRRTLRGITG